MRFLKLIFNQKGSITTTELIILVIICVIIGGTVLEVIYPVISEVYSNTEQGITSITGGGL